MSEEYTIADITTVQPEYSVEQGTLHINGVPVKDWQLTPQEVLRFVPHKWNALYPDGPCYCPVCDNRIPSYDKRGITMHMRQLHAQIYESLGTEKIESVSDYIGLYGLIKEAMKEQKDDANN